MKRTGHAGLLLGAGGLVYLNCWLCFSHFRSIFLHLQSSNLTEEGCPFVGFWLGNCSSSCISFLSLISFGRLHLGRFRSLHLWCPGCSGRAGPHGRTAWGQRGAGSLQGGHVHWRDGHRVRVRIGVTSVLATWQPWRCWARHFRVKDDLQM